MVKGSPPASGIASPTGPVRAVPVQIRLKAAIAWRAAWATIAPLPRLAGAVEDEAALEPGSQRGRLGGGAGVEAGEQVDDFLEAALDGDLLAAHEDVGEGARGRTDVAHLLGIDRDLAAAALLEDDELRQTWPPDPLPIRPIP